MKKIIKGIKWVFLAIIGIALIILIPIGAVKLYEHTRGVFLSEQEKLQEDLERFEYLVKNNFSGYNVLPTTDAFNTRLAEIKKGIAENKITNREQFGIEVIKAISAFKDPHTFVYNRNELFDRRFPYRLSWSDGDFYLTSGQVDKEWLGARVIRLNDTPGKAVFEKLSVYTNAPNEAGTAFFMGSYPSYPMILRTEGIITDTDQIELEVSLNGKTTILSFKSLTNEDFGRLNDYITMADNNNAAATPLYKTKENINYWYEYDKTERTFYLRYKLCVPQGDINAFWDEVFDQLEELQPDKFVIDVRNNPGGDTKSHNYFLQLISQNKRWNQYGKLFTLINGGTGSAAVSFAADMERLTETILVGEKTMDKANTTSDPTFFTLPHSEITLLIPSLYSLHTHLHDLRDAVIPHLTIHQDYEGSNYFQDKVMDSIKNLDLEDHMLQFAKLPANASGRFSYSPIRNASVIMQDSIWYLSVEGLFEAPIYQEDSLFFTRKYNARIWFTDSAINELHLEIHNSALDLHRIDQNAVSLTQAINNRDFKKADVILEDLNSGGKLPYYLDRPFFQSRTYKLYNEYGFEAAADMNELARKYYPDDPVVSIVNYELHSFENSTWGQVKSIPPVAGKLIQRYFDVITSEKIMNDDYNAFIGN